MLPKVIVLLQIPLMCSELKEVFSFEGTFLYTFLS